MSVYTWAQFYKKLSMADAQRKAWAAKRAAGVEPVQSGNYCPCGEMKMFMALRQRHVCCPPVTQYVSLQEQEVVANKEFWDKVEAVANLILKEAEYVTMAAIEKHLPEAQPQAIGKALKGRGWKRSQPRRDGGRVRVYVPPD